MDKREKGTRRRKRKRRVAIVKRGKRRVRRGESDILKREKGKKQNNQNEKKWRINFLPGRISPLATPPRLKYYCHLQR